MRLIRNVGFAVLMAGVLSMVPVRAEEPDEGMFDYDDVKDRWVQVEVGFHTSQLDGDLLLDRDVGDTKVDLDRTLDLDEDDGAIARLEVQPFEGSFFRFGAFGLEYGKTTRLRRSITVDGETYSATDTVSSDLQLDTYEFGYRIDALSLGPLTLSPMLQANLIDLDAEFKNRTTGQTVSEDSLVPVPYPGLRAEFFPWARLGAYGEVKYIAGNTSDIDVSARDFEAGVQLNLKPTYNLRVGYREFDYDVEFDETEADLNSSGPYATLLLNF